VMEVKTEQALDEATQQPTVRIKDGKHVEVAYPSGRLVRYLYNGLISEVQLPLIPPPVTKEKNDGQGV